MFVDSIRCDLSFTASRILESFGNEFLVEDEFLEI